MTRLRDLSAGVSWILVASIGAGGLNYCYSLALAAILPSRQYSVFASGQALLLITGAVANAALPWLVAREIARSQGARETEEVLWFALLVNLVEGIVVGFCSALIALGFTGLEDGLWTGMATVGFFLASTGMGWAQGYERFALLGALVVGEVAVKVAAGVLLALTGSGPSGPFAAAFAGAVVVFAVMLKPMRHQLRPRMSAMRRSRLWVNAVGMTTVQAMVTAMSVADILIVSFRFGTGSASAAYQVAATAARTPLFVAFAFATEAFPGLARRPGDRALLSSHQDRLIRVFAPLLIVTTTLPITQAAGLLPASYAAGVRYLPITSAIGTAYALVIFQTTALRAGGHIKEAIMTLGLGCVASVAAMLVGSETSVMALGVGAAVGAWITCVALVVVTEKIWPGAQRPTPRPLVGWAMAGGLMVAARILPLAWVVGAAGLSMVAARAALSPASTD